MNQGVREETRDEESDGPHERDLVMENGNFRPRILMASLVNNKASALFAGYCRSDRGLPGATMDRLASQQLLIHQNRRSGPGCGLMV